MGLISFFKNRLKKEISIDFDISSFLVYVYKLRKGRVKVASKIKVQDGFDFVLAKSGKVLDIFSSGEHEALLVKIPKSVKKFKLDKEDRYGKLPKYFRADAYFVNKNLINYFPWKSYRKIHVFDKAFGDITFSMSGIVAFKVADTEKFMSSLLGVYDYLKNKEAESIVEGFISDFLVSYCEKQNYSYSLLFNKNALTDVIYEKLCEKMKSYGIEIMGFLIEEISLPKHLVKKVEQLNEKSKAKNQITVEKISGEKKIDIPNEKDYSTSDKKIRCLLCGHENEPFREDCEVCHEKLKRRKSLWNITKIWLLVKL